MSQRISREALRALVAEWLAAGKKVVGPVRVKAPLVLYAPLGSADALLLDGWTRPANSIKELVFPRHEALYGYRIAKNRVELVDLAPEIPERIAIGAHPCDAAALTALDKVFNWGCRDEFYNRRRAATTVVTLACSAHDEQCFCTSVGLGPAAERGSDAVLFESDGGYEVRVVSEKGRRLFGGVAGESAFPAPRTGGAGASACQPFPARFDPARVAAFAKEHFEDPFWAELALACVGCGACAYTCPACHCFDMVDEGNGREGLRIRNWDACQFPMFTLHASGHNPRADQGARQRQRIYHKFVMYPEKFGEILCTGCGNCARNCPAGLGVLPAVTEIGNG
jgi:ferredoxin